MRNVIVITGILIGSTTVALWAFAGATYWTWPEGPRTQERACEAAAPPPAPAPLAAAAGDDVLATMGLDSAVRFVVASP